MGRTTFGRIGIVALALFAISAPVCGNDFAGGSTIADVLSGVKSVVAADVDGDGGKFLIAFDRSEAGSFGTPPRDVIGQMVPAREVDRVPYDPENARMRG